MDCVHRHKVNPSAGDLVPVGNVYCRPAKKACRTLEDHFNNGAPTAPFRLKTAPKLQNQPLRTSVAKRRWNTMCLCAIVRHKHNLTHTRGRYRDRKCKVSKPRTQNHNNGYLKISQVSQVSNLKPRDKALSYRAFCLVKLTRQASKERDSSIHVYGGEPKARQLW